MSRLSASCFPPGTPFASRFPPGTPYADRLTAAKNRAKCDPRAAVVRAVLDTWNDCRLDELTVLEVLDALDAAQ